MTSKWFEKDV